jgi:hypothetical protein
MAPAPPQVVYPLNGATNIPDGNFTLVVGTTLSPVSLAINGNVVFANLASAPVPSPLPSPSLPNAAGSAGYAVPALHPATTYQVIAPVSVSGCFDENHPPSPSPTAIGSFTTQ